MRGGARTQEQGRRRGQTISRGQTTGGRRGGGIISGRSASSTASGPISQGGQGGSRALRSCLPIRGVTGKVICAASKQCIGVLRVRPVGFLLQDTERRRNVVCDFVDCLGVDPIGLRVGVVSGGTSVGGRLRRSRLRLRQRASPRYRRLRHSCVRFIRGLDSERTMSEQFFLVFRCRPFGTGQGRRRQRVLTTLRATSRATGAFLCRYKGRIISRSGRSRFAASILCALLGHALYARIPLSGQVDAMLSTCAGRGHVRRLSRVQVGRFLTPRDISFGRSRCIRVGKLCRSCLLIPSSNCGGQMAPK